MTVKSIYGPESIKEKGSQFIAYLFPVDAPIDAEKHIHNLRKKYHDATHVCFAYRLKKNTDEYYRYSDDGEPGSTAGVPIFNEIKGKNYYNILVAVIRYFGGIKLGTGGLVRAYSTAARKVIDSAQCEVIHIKKNTVLNFPYPLTGDMMQLLNRHSAEIIERKYTMEGVSIRCAIPLGSLEDFAQAVSDISSGKIHLSVIEESNEIQNQD